MNEKDKLALINQIESNIELKIRLREAVLNDDQESIRDIISKIMLDTNTYASKKILGELNEWIISKFLDKDSILYQKVEGLSEDFEYRLSIYKTNRKAKGKLKIRWTGEAITIITLSNFLRDLSHAYQSINALLFADKFGNSLDDTPEMEDFNDLKLSAVQINSPGFWEVVGSLNPLLQIREYINDAHKRKKEREYLNSIEKQRLILDNELKYFELVRLDNQIIQERIQLLKEAGFTTDQIKQMVLNYMEKPLLGLGKYSNYLTDGNELTPLK
jgi:hypothetical protein